jgi:hypothetical protein
MEGTVRYSKLGSWLRHRASALPVDKLPRGFAASRREAGDPLLEGLNKHAGPAWVASSDLKSISANRAARARIHLHAAQCDPCERDAARRRLTRIYEESLRSALKTATQGRDSLPAAGEWRFPQRVSCIVRGEKLELLVLEVCATSSPRHNVSQAADRGRTVAYLLVA